MIALAPMNDVVLENDRPRDEFEMGRRRIVSAEDEHHAIGDRDVVADREVDHAGADDEAIDLHGRVAADPDLAAAAVEPQSHVDRDARLHLPAQHMAVVEPPQPMAGRVGHDAVRDEEQERGRVEPELRMRASRWLAGARIAEGDRGYLHVEVSRRLCGHAATAAR